MGNQREQGNPDDGGQQRRNTHGRKTGRTMDMRKYYAPMGKEHDACGIGTIVNIDGHKDYQVLDNALSIVEKLEHRAGKNATGKVGDGVGILTQISHPFFRAEAAKCGISLKGERDYGIGMMFLPQDRMKRTFAMRMMQVITEKEGLKFLGWREVPTHPEILGKEARDCMPSIMQCFVERPEETERGIDFDRRLYVVRREFEQSSEDTYICSFSSRTIVYKGMFLVRQLRKFYTDLQSHEYKTAIAIVHSRFSTNTTPPRGKAVALFHHQFLKGHKKSGQTPVGICPPLLVSYGKHYAARRLSKACRSISSVMLRSSRSLRALQIVFHRGNRY